ncbi:oligosaccharide flippase family protein [Gluconacetobacter asukensis]|uniref:Oligosaccharide flippase family protein n=1 Tax=Gluconacetobacter asukensis TaxID=1017181 RepID=A0A7W4P0F6_9PROT|nr:oligosaccharide flippase family protein [Gluconacetobacter asukensis]
MIRGAIASLGSRLLDLPSRYGFHLLVAAELGVVESGLFYIVFSVMVMLSGFGRLGIDRALTRQVARDVASHRHDTVRPAIASALRLVLMASAIVAMLLAALAFPLARHILHKPTLAWPLALGALSIIPQNISTVLGGALAGLHRVAFSQMIYSWLWPTIFCLVAVPLGLTGYLTVTNAVSLIAASFALTAIVGAVLLRHFLVSTPQNSGISGEKPDFLTPGLSLFTLELIQLLLASAPAISLGIGASAFETGLFALAWRIALIDNLLISGVAGMVAPKFAALHARHDRSGLNRSAAHAVGLVLCLALPVTACMMLFPGHLLALFGHGYAQGSSTLRILAIGQFVAVCFTAMPELLGMTDHAATLRKINIISFSVLFLGLAVLVPLAGSVGAAIATSLTIAVNGISASWAAYRLLGIFPLASLWQSVLSYLPGTPESRKP